MNIFLDAHLFDETYQGSRSYLKGLYSEWFKLNLTIHFFVAAYNIENLKSEFGENENVTYVKLHSRNKLCRLLFDIPYLCWKYKVDYAHFQYISPIIKSCKEIVTTHDILFIDFPELFPFLYRIKNKILFRRSARRADILLTVSEYSKKAIVKHLKINPDKIYVTPNAVSSDFIENSENKLIDIKEKYKLDKYILYVSRLEPRKNHLLLVEAFVELKLIELGYSLVFVGKKDFPSEEYNNYIRNLSEDFQQKIIHLEGIPYVDLVSIYKNCSLFVFPSLAEGFGIPPLEAIISKVPCICSKTTAMGDFSFMERNLFDPKNKEDLKKLMMDNINNYNNETIEQNYQYVKLNYDWSKIAYEWNKYFINQLK